MFKKTLGTIFVFTITASSSLLSMNVKTLDSLSQQNPSGTAANAFLERTDRNLARPSLGRRFVENTFNNAGESFGQCIGQGAAQAATPLLTEVGEDGVYCYRAGKQAVSNGYQLLKEKFTAQCATETGDAARFPLHQAVARNNLAAIIRRLQNHPKELNQLDDDGYTPLMVAIMMGHKALVQQLLQHSPDLDLLNNNGDSALSIARQCNSFDMVKQISKQQKKQGEAIERRRVHPVDDSDQEESQATQEPVHKRQRVHDKDETAQNMSRSPLIGLALFGFKMLYR